MKNLHQFIIWLQLLKSSPIREDHYDGINALYRLSAVIEKDSLGEKVSLGKQLYELLQNIETWSVVPNEIVVFPDRIEIHWYAKEFQMVMTRSQYLKLIIQFLFFLSNAQSNIQFLKRCLMESPDRTVWGAPNEMINYSPTFSSTSFGLEGEKIKVLILNEKVEAVA
ncbi:MULTISPECIES: hypothetical protein [Bacillaceae]|uniref:Uncharacterized protein n=1 Tax=Niallia alba TaxID=2729105 RepID=A0A7Y0KCQ1_9BACI|nr:MULTISPECIES: hypothetical protein [Bacillaceae]MCM3411128.1 hypothetical protein [Metabacillus litoralis]NMO80052.1 hypothetical protein [Niallia alba]